jgi:hypothetical protein
MRAMLPWRRQARPAESDGEDVHLFLLWPAALVQADRILADVERRFRIRELVRVHWSPERFPENLRRFYGASLPAGVDKHGQTGEGDLLVVLVTDPTPQYRLRRRTIGKALVNANVFDAKQRYREWTGSHLVHATNDSRETAKDLFLLFGRRADDVARSEGRARPAVQSCASDIVGADGWASLEQLLTALELSGGYALLGDELGQPLTVLTWDSWTAAILKARRLGDGQIHEVLVANEPTPLVLSWIGDGLLPTAWQEAILRSAVRSPAGMLTASPRDRFYLSLHQMLQAGLPPSADEARELSLIAIECDAPAGDYTDLGFIRSMLETFVGAFGGGEHQGRRGRRRARSIVRRERR